MTVSRESTNDRCPSCNADLDGGPIPEEVRQNYAPPYRWSRRISVIDRSLDADVAFKCPDCDYHWPSNKIQPHQTLTPRQMRRVILESPFAGDFEANITYARACVRDALLRGEAPLASHLLYTQDGILDDTIQNERAHGINAGHAWLHLADAVVVYTDRGISDGMKAGITLADFHKIPIEHRSIGKGL